MREWYDDHDHPSDSATDLADRVTHLVFVGGRLVDTWTEHADDGRWRGYVERPAPPPPPPPPPVHVQVLDWLADVCGGRAALDALDAAPLTDDATRLPTVVPTRQAEEWLTTTAELLDSVAERWFDEETSYAFRHALLALWVEDPTVVTRPRSAAHLAGGICWAVGKANGLFHPAGTRRVGAVQGTLGLSGGLSGPGNEVAAALRGFRGRPLLEPWRRLSSVPDLLALGRSDVLLGSTRERLVRLRERARAAAA